MTSSILRRIGLLAIILAVLLTGPGSALPLRALPVIPTDGSEVETSFEGYIKAMGLGKWLIGSQRVLVDGSTLLIEKRGKAEVGAWVIVWATLSENGSIRARIIYVDRPAGRAGPAYQFSGIISKQFEDFWIVDDLLIKVNQQTQVTGEPTTGWLVWVVAEDEGDGLRGINIEAIAGRPEDLPVEFEGEITSILPDRWRVDNEEISISPETLILDPPPMVHYIAEVKATRDAGGQLHAHMIRVLKPTAQATAVSQTASSPVQGAELRNWGASPSVVTNASSATSPWNQPEAIATGFQSAAMPSIAYDAARVAHALWEAQGQIYYACQAPGAKWSPAKRIATGAAPTVKADNSGRIHALFHNEFFGNYDIYYLVLNNGAWSLPINVSRTEGTSLEPALAIDEAGIVRAAWTDNTPNYWTIYTGYYDGKFWRNYPAPNARGQDPAIATALNGTLYMAWQDRTLTAGDSTAPVGIFISQYSNGVWTLPINVSAQTGVDATSVSVTTTYDSIAHLTWIVGDRTIIYRSGYDLHWSAPRTIVQATKAVHGPRIIAEKGKIIHMAWDEGDVVRATKAVPASATWPKPEIVALTAGQLKDVSLSDAQGGGITIGWAEVSQPNNAGVYASAQASSFPPRVWLPLIATSTP